MTSKSSIKYYVVDAFSDTPLHGNPAAVCLLQEEKKEQFLQSVAREFNLSATCYITKIIDSNLESNSKKSDDNENCLPKYRLRWFAPATELNICGHGTIAAAYVLFQIGLVEASKVEFHIQSGKILLAEKIKDVDKIDALYNRTNEFPMPQNFSVRLIFPLVPFYECDSSEKELAITFTDCRHRPINVVKMSYEEELIVEYASGSIVADLCPSINDIKKWRGRGVVVTGAAPKDSGYDFYSRFFCPNLGMNEDPVCGSIHCSVAPYWSRKLEKNDLKAYMASPRGGQLNLHVDEARQQVLIQGKATRVMEGLLYV